MSTPPDGNAQIIRTGEVNRIHNVFNAFTACDKCGALIYHGVPNGSRMVIAIVTIEQQLPSQAIPQFSYGGCFQCCFFTTHLYGLNRWRQLGAVLTLAS
jgi:hypothetical protein